MESLTSLSDTLVWVLSIVFLEAAPHLMPRSVGNCCLCVATANIWGTGMESLMASGQDEKLNVEKESKDKWGSALAPVTVCHCF